ncbi:MAG: hypothetical protein NTV49_06555 [Kiritimatiellaeota bacterium]|nr:hypothetical protein [Kiritimatiellota bacterium]
MPVARPIMSACCLCGRVRFGAQWLAVPDRVARRLELSHGFCPACLPRAMEKAMDSFPRGLPLTRQAAPVVA